MADVAELAALLRRLRAQPDELAAKAANAVRVVPEHTWEARARQVAADLRALRRSPPPAGAAVVGERVPRPAGGRPEPRRRTRPGMTGAGTGWTRDS